MISSQYAEPAEEVLSHWYTRIIEKTWISLIAAGNQVKKMEVYLTIEDEPGSDELTTRAYNHDQVKLIFRDGLDEDPHVLTKRFMKSRFDPVYLSSL